MNDKAQTSTYTITRPGDRPCAAESFSDAQARALIASSQTGGEYSIVKRTRAGASRVVGTVIGAQFFVSDAEKQREREKQAKRDNAVAKAEKRAAKKVEAQ